jgi:hypothetical protein
VTAGSRWEDLYQLVILELHFSLEPSHCLSHLNAHIVCYVIAMLYNSPLSLIFGESGIMLFSHGKKEEAVLPG